MITPLVDEDEWLSALRTIPTWTPPAKSTIVIAPHPDDETLGVGGFIASQIQRGTVVSVIAVTDGEAAYSNYDDLAQIRQVEQQRAVECLGVTRPIVRLRLPDSAVAKHEAELADLLRPLINAEVLVVAPWETDWHPDHEACARATQQVCADSGAELVSYVFWTWHQRTADVFENVKLQRFDLDAALQTSKLHALHCHRSQLASNSGEPILPERLLAPAKRSFETFIFHA